MPVTGAPTTMCAVVEKLPSAVVAVIVVQPKVIPITMPSLPTTATDVLLLVQVTFLLLALAGSTLAVSVREFPG